MEEGILAGYPIVNLKCLFDGSYHSVDSSEMAFKIAASMALKKGFVDATRCFWSRFKMFALRYRKVSWAM